VSDDASPVSFMVVGRWVTTASSHRSKMIRARTDQQDYRGVKYARDSHPDLTVAGRGGQRERPGWVQ